MSVQNFIKEELEKAGIKIPSDEVINSLIASVEAAFFKISEIIESFVAFIRQNVAYCFDEFKQTFDEAYAECAEFDKRKNGYAYKKADIYFENKKYLLKQTRLLCLYRFNKHLIRHKLIC